MLAQATAEATRRGAVFASLLSDVVDGRPVAASLLVSMAAGQHGGAIGHLDALADRLRAGVSDTGEAEVGVVDLPAGLAVRTRRRTVTRSESRQVAPTEVESVQYFVPVPGTAALLVLSFSTPSLTLADALVALFDAIAESLAWL